MPHISEGGGCPEGSLSKCADGRRGNKPKIMSAGNLASERESTPVTMSVSGAFCWRFLPQKTLREKNKLLASDGTDEWSAHLCEDWMQVDPVNAGILYIDGHTRVYHGSQTQLPRHHVASQCLCMCATDDYWVNGFEDSRFSKSTVPSIQECSRCWRTTRLRGAFASSSTAKATTLLSLI